ncbi:PRC-barrel domain-containing protein [Pseudochelatococcus contaminans]|uniref:Sporulation protein YlmC with PRC-barrel domain n=1 Tax=Pseudochelatococcus contaminans TaxID=1538103 RepID=A0A7W5Z5Y9_9HYPH|nr:PRC-barrel domain-containing protein [Pseudochelatococcus contaminans]MBB3810821.1 sporulation protein YlmC with PRC-barrel domain [Pseudochelatococcus contaminans]
MAHLDDTAGTLIGADNVSGTAVYNAAGEDLGSIHDIIIDKKTGRVAYAVLSFGGFLGIGEKYHPLPWSALTYDVNQGGYVVHLTREQLEGAPQFGAEERPDWRDRAYEQRIHDYYGIGPYWL